VTPPVTAIFGGTFDPIHVGHIGMAQAIVDAGAAERVIFMPAHIPPHKRGRQISSGEIRLEMVNLAIADKPAFATSDWELTRDEVSYTWHTANHFAEEFGDCLRLVIGMDSLVDLPNWYRAEELAAQFHFIVYRRPDSPPPPAKLLKDALGAVSAAKLLESIVDGPTFPVSSTEIRRRCASGESVNSLLPPAVATYVAENELYLTTETT
jgi:nicotinate-nucleotide adenylyltransferase